MDMQAPVDSCDCEPFVYMPAWWSSFLFQVLPPRALAVYTYIAMLGAANGISRPTARQIQADMGLASDSVVFDALRLLEELMLIRRRRENTSRQNAYSRPSCQTTLIRLLETNRIDSRLRAVTEGHSHAVSDDIAELVRNGLHGLLGEDFSAYAAAGPAERRDVLISLLRRSLARRARVDDCVCD
jgi:hypothetical protein